MSNYTISIYNLMQTNFDFGLQDYEIFNEEYRPILNNAILSYYKFREIGFDNPIVFRDRLNQRMDLIMRNKYNALYKAKAIEFNPLYNIEIIETFDHDVNSSSSDESTAGSSNENLQLNSRFPSEEMTEDDLSSNLFIDSALKNKATVNDKNLTKGENKSKESYTRKTEGSSAGLPFSKAMIQLKDFYEKYRLDEQVIAELSDLFMNVW